jgi:hypothetical protein
LDFWDVRCAVKAALKILYLHEVRVFITFRD